MRTILIQNLFFSLALIGCTGFKGASLGSAVLSSSLGSVSTSNVAATPVMAPSCSGSQCKNTAPCALLSNLHDGVCVDSDPAHMRLVQQNPSALPGKMQIGGVGSGAFNPNKLKHWNPDERGAILNPNGGTYRNIYAPQAVLQNGSFWNVYFGGWDGTSTPHDQVYLTTTNDNFGSFGAHATVISHGDFFHVNNESVVRVSPTDWRMVYTTVVDGGLNKPCYATSRDGGSWSPSSGTTQNLLNVSGYENWDTADVNGGNTIIRDEAGLWHLYFKDFVNNPNGIQHATSTDFVNYTFQNQSTDTPYVPQDLKAFTYAGQTYYFGLYHVNSQHVWGTVSTDLAKTDAPIELFANAGDADKYIVAAGLVQDGSRVYGALYGAGPDTTLAKNQIFASWLQKKVIFVSASHQMGDAETSFGPDAVRVYFFGGVSEQTGQFYVYDTDGTTLLYVSPTVTVRPGDVWAYSGL